MSRRFLLAVLIPITLAISFATCFEFVPPVDAPPDYENSTEYTDPTWEFPAHSEPAPPLPDFRPVVAQVMPGVVSVTTESFVSGFFGSRTEYGAGSGIIIDDAGYIVTNDHVVENAQSIYVELHDDRVFEADIVGTDPISDLAVIKIDADDLIYAHWGDSSSLSVGEWVLAIGNALGEGVRATQGIVSRLNVSLNVEGNVLYGLVETTAAINPGNSGGPLVNMAGEVIGITSIKIVATGVEGTGFAISSEEAELIIPSLIRYGRMTYPWLGVGLYTVDPALAAAGGLSVEYGALIVELVANSPAHGAGLRVDDIIIRFGGQDIRNVADLVKAVRRSEIGEDIEVVFVRGEDTRTTPVQLIERPSP